MKGSKEKFNLTIEGERREEGIEASTQFTGSVDNLAFCMAAVMSALRESLTKFKPEVNDEEMEKAFNNAICIFLTKKCSKDEIADFPALLFQSIRLQALKQCLYDEVEND